MTEEQINKAINLIDNYQLADAFEFLDKAGFKNSSYAKMKKSFIQGIQDVDFIGRLKTLLRNAKSNSDNNNSSQDLQNSDKNKNSQDGQGNFSLQNWDLDGSNITLNINNNINKQQSENSNSNASSSSKEDFENDLQNALEEAKGTTYESIIQDKIYEYQRWKLAKHRGDISTTEFLDKETKIDREVRDMLRNL